MEKTIVKYNSEERKTKIKNIIKTLKVIEVLDNEERQGVNPADLDTSFATSSIVETAHTLLNR